MKLSFTSRVVAFAQTLFGFELSTKYSKARLTKEIKTLEALERKKKNELELLNNDSHAQAEDPLKHKTDIMSLADELEIIPASLKELRRHKKIEVKSNETAVKDAFRWPDHLDRSIRAHRVSYLRWLVTTFYNNHVARLLSATMDSRIATRSRCRYKEDIWYTTNKEDKTDKTKKWHQDTTTSCCRKNNPDDDKPGFAMGHGKIWDEHQAQHINFGHTLDADAPVAAPGEPPEGEGVHRGELKVPDERGDEYILYRWARLTCSRG